MQSESFPLISRLSGTLDKAIAILDCETTSLIGNKRVGLVELAILVFTPDGKIQSWQELINPGIPISWQATKVHGIHNRDVAYSPLFATFIPQIRCWLENSIIAGFNSRAFDIPVIKSNVHYYLQEDIQINQQLDIRDIWIAHQGKKSGKLAAVAEYYHVIAENAHRAMGDVLTTAKILEAMIWRHGADFVSSYMHKLELHASKNGVSLSTSSSLPATTALSATTLSTTATLTVQKLSTTDVIRQIILQYISQHQKLLPKEYSLLANKAQQETSTKVTASNISFLLSTMLDENHIALGALEDNQSQQLINKNLERAIHIAGNEGRLKPIKIALDGLTQRDIDYVQLKIALKKHGLR